MDDDSLSASTTPVARDAGPASPEVLSSLIDSLSAIPLPAQDHFEKLPRFGGSGGHYHSVPGSPVSWQSGFQNGSAGFGVEYGVYRYERWQDERHDGGGVEDAAESPVVKTAPPPSGYSSITARNRHKRDKEGDPLYDYVGSSARSCSSLNSRRSSNMDDSSSIASGIARGLRRHSAISGTSLEDRRSTARLNGPSSPLPSPTKSVPKPASPSRLSLQSMRAYRIDEEGPAPIRPAISVSETRDRGLRWPEDSIPSRTSSLWFQTQSPMDHKRMSSLSLPLGRILSHAGQMDENEEAKAGKKSATRVEHEEESQVTRRIRELKRQKEIRDREVGNSLRLTVGAESHAPPRPSSGLRTPLSPITRALAFEEQQRPIEESLAKAYKMLGLAPSGIKRSLTNPLPLRDGLHPSQPRHDEQLNDDVDDALRIDYRLALRALNLCDGTDDTTWCRSHSITADRLSGRGETASAREASKSDLHIEWQSLRASPPASPNQARPGVNSIKRWSHPDVSLTARPTKDAETHGANDASGLCKLPLGSSQSPEGVPEDPRRPSTGDSIDDEVDAFLEAPRLTQKVREKETGRTICFSEVGDPNGFVVFVCVGMGLTRFVTAFYDELATSLKLRLITPDRPGVGDSQADPQGTPLGWSDDVACICKKLKIATFSIMAHSAGAIYALATALRMPQQVRGRVHLLAPWIPPSQMTAAGLPVSAQTPERQLPMSQRILRVLPTPLLKVANSTFMSTTSTSITRSVPKSPLRVKRRSFAASQPNSASRMSAAASRNRDSMMLMDRVLPDAGALEVVGSDPTNPNYKAAAAAQARQQRRQEYGMRRTLRVWDKATTKANPAVDLLVCLERTQQIGFRYIDITRAVVIHHGSRDTRVPVENVKWLGRTMKRCEVRILEGETHGLMANAVVMSNVLSEMAREWEDWTARVRGQSNQGP